MSVEEPWRRVCSSSHRNGGRCNRAFSPVAPRLWNSFLGQSRQSFLASVQKGRTETVLYAQASGTRSPFPRQTVLGLKSNCTFRRYGILPPMQIPWNASLGWAEADAFLNRSFITLLLFAWEAETTCSHLKNVDSPALQESSFLLEGRSVRCREIKQSPAIKCLKGTLQR